MANSHDPVGTFHEEFPDPALRGICRAIQSAYPLTEKMLRDAAFTKEQAHDLRPYLRRENIEAAVLLYGKRLTEVTITTCTNSTKTHHHNRIVCGRVELTVHYVYDRGDMVEEAEFRTQYARDADYDLFMQEEPPPEARLYGFLLHVPDRPDGTDREIIRHRPAFMDIYFPDKLCKRYVGDRVELYKRFPELCETQDSQAAQQQPRPLLRRQDDVQGQ